MLQWPVCPMPKFCEGGLVVAGLGSTAVGLGGAVSVLSVGGGFVRGGGM